MAITHATVKAPGQKLFAGADWNAGHVADSALVPNLNADLLDGNHASAFQAAGTYVTSVTGTLPVSSTGGTTPDISLGYNTTNLKVTANQLNTIQDIATTSKPQFAGVGLGAAMISNRLIYGSGLFDAKSVYGIYMTANCTSRTRASITTIQGLYFFGGLAPSGTLSQDTAIGTMYGVNETTKAISYPGEEYNTTITWFVGYNAALFLQRGTLATGALTAIEAYNFRATNPSASNGATITTLYGFYDDGQTAGVTSWGFYGLSAQNAMSGKLAIGSVSAPTYTCDVTGDANVSGIYRAGGVAGFTGTGAYTNFTIVGGIITAAS